MSLCGPSAWWGGAVWGGAMQYGGDACAVWRVRVNDVSCEL